MRACSGTRTKAKKSAVDPEDSEVLPCVAAATGATCSAFVASALEPRLLELATGLAPVGGGGPEGPNAQARFALRRAEKRSSCSRMSSLRRMIVSAEGRARAVITRGRACKVRIDVAPVIDAVAARDFEILRMYGSGSQRACSHAFCILHTNLCIDQRRRSFLHGDALCSLPSQEGVQDAAKQVLRSVCLETVATETLTDKTRNGAEIGSTCAHLAVGGLDGQYLWRHINRQGRVSRVSDKQSARLRAVRGVSTQGSNAFATLL